MLQIGCSMPWSSKFSILFCLLAHAFEAALSNPLCCLSAILAITPENVISGVSNENHFRPFLCLGYEAPQRHSRIANV